MATKSSVTSNRTATEIPLDFSFFSIVDPKEIESEEPRDHNNKKVAKVKVEEENEEGETVIVEKYKTKCLRMNNNMITELSSLMKIMTKSIVDPQVITWIDLSFNAITKIDPVFCDLGCLQILYFHGNSISDLNEVDKLAGVPCLRKLTLHGNSLDTTKNYRSLVLSQIPQLQCLDFSTVTKADKATAKVMKKVGTGKKKKRSDED